MEIQKENEHTAVLEQLNALGGVGASEAYPISKLVSKMNC